MKTAPQWLGISPARWTLLVAIAAALVGLSVVLRAQLDLAWSIESLRALVARAGIWGPILYIAILGFRFAVLVPSSILLAAAGVCFGAVPGTLYATLGLTLSALLKFAVAEVAGRDFLLRQLPAPLRARLEVGDRRSTMASLTLVCAYPFGPKHVFQIAALLSGMPFSKYVFAVASGAKFRASAFAVLGDAIATGEGIALVSLVLLAAAVVPFLIPCCRDWLRSPQGAHP